MGPSTAKSKCPVVHSDNELSEDEQPVKKQPKWTLKPSTKVAETDKENLKKANTEITKLEKKMLKYQSQKADKEEDMERDSDNDIESKDKEGLGFLSSIWPLQHINKPTQTPVCCINLAELNCSTAHCPSQLSSSINQAPVHHHTNSDNEDNNNPQASIAHGETGGSVTAGSAGSPNDEQPPSGDNNEPETHGLLPALLGHGIKLTAPPAVNDFANPVVQSLLLGSIHIYEAHIAGQHAFSSLAVQVTWATDAWKEVQDECNKKLGDMDAPRYEFTDQMLCILKRHSSCIHGDFLGAVCNEVQIVFGFQRDKASHIKKNANKATLLYDNKSVHFKNPSTQEGFYKGPIILSVLTATLFRDPGSLSIIHEEIFNPISLHTLALVLTLVKFCISEWKTGKYEQGVFSEKQYKVSCEVYFQDLKAWYFVNPDMMTNHRKKLYQCAFKASGTEGVAGPVATLVGENREHACKELKGHTGETDSELDEEDGDVDEGGEGT